MGGLTICWEYLTGHAVATDPANRDRVEWPPHPARVFMALAAAWFETDEDPAEGEALRWIESLGHPEMRVPASGCVSRRSVVTVYVPVNDKAGPSAAPIQSAPTLTRNRQARTFPQIWVGNYIIQACWPEAEDFDQHREALERLCDNVTRIGHSSSLVRMWISDETDVNSSSHGSGFESLVPDSGLADHHMRTISPGTLDMLTDRFGAELRNRHFAIQDEIESLKAKKKGIRGRGATDRKREIDSQVERLEQELEQVPLIQPIRPVIGQWSGYQRNRDVTVPDLAHTLFDADLLILCKRQGRPLPLASTLRVTRAMRQLIMKESGAQPAPAWVTGHRQNGDRLESEDGHLALVPLPSVGHPHSDGHILGIALVFPRSIDRCERGKVLGRMLISPNGEPRVVTLDIPGLAKWSLEKRSWDEMRKGLLPETWTADWAGQAGACHWASVTPVVLDRFPKSHRAKERGKWTDEVAGIIVESCRRIGLPEPVQIDIDTTSWIFGSPRSIAKRRRLRGHDASGGPSDAGLGEAFPPFPPKGTNAPRPQVHVWMRFAKPVIGPITIGAGRFLGYGLLKPDRYPT